MPKKEVTNQETATALLEIARLLEIKETSFRARAYKKAALALENIKEGIFLIYKQKGIKGLQEVSGIGKSISQKIEEYLKKGEIKYLKELRAETAVQQVIAHYFETKGVSLSQLKTSAKKQKIIYSRFTKPAKQLLDLAGSLEKAKQAITKVAAWAKSRNLDYAIETVFKKWLELDRLQPKEVVKKPFYEGKPMFFSQTKKKWFVVADSGEWLEFCDKMDKIDWRIC